jgi:signal transduction histidine kinase
VSPSLRRLRGAPLNAVLALVLLVIGESQVLLGWHDGGVGAPPDEHRVVRALLCMALVVPLAWRRSRPLPVAGLIAAAVVAQVLVVPYVPFLAGLLPLTIANYGAAAYGRRGRPGGLLFALVAVAVIFARIPEERAAGEVLFTLFVVVGTWVAGDVVHARVARANASVAAANATLTEQERAYAEALEDERARIARELHDVIAHSVSLMGVQAGAARMLLDTDAEAARDALLSIELTARDSVTELQRLLTVLRGDESSPDRSPQPGLGQLTSLVERMRDAGLPVRLHVERGDAVVPAGADLTAYRIVQEALTNALKHAGTATVVRVRHHEGDVEIEVCNALAPRRSSAAGGHGIVGMRERAQLYGGTLRAGPDEHGGFVVHAALPLDPERAPAPAWP